MRRVVVTGLGTINPLGCSVKNSWERLVNASSGIRTIAEFDTSDLPVKIAGTIPYKQDKFDTEQYMPLVQQRRIDNFILYGYVAAIQAVIDANLENVSDFEKERTGVMLGSGIGGLQRIYDAALTLHNSGYRKLSPFFIPGALVNLLSGHVSIKYGFQGPAHACSTACATGSHAIGDAARLIMFGDAEVMIAGGAEAGVCRIGIAGFAAARALSRQYNDIPQQASRPWDSGRDGFVIGEGAGVVVLEELEHAKSRGANIYAELVGYGLSGDAYHITSPHPEGQGGVLAMQAALRNAQINAEDINYINAHATATIIGDSIEIKSIRRLFNNCLRNVAISSTKSATGHLLGAAGAVEAIFAILAINDGLVPPTINLDNPDADFKDLNLVPHTTQKKKLEYVMSNSFGFGGANTSIIFKKYQG